MDCSEFYEVGQISTYVEKSKTSLQSSVTIKSEETEERYFVLEFVLSLFIESSSLADFFSDYVILQALAMSVDTMWFSFTLFTMLCPYYTVYTSLMTF